ncbi:MAG: MbcA/ParS/Xre antitoxin family protein [Mucilaginibacter sp.]
MAVINFDSLQSIPADLLKHGIEVLGTEEEFIKWLNAINFFFDKKAPIEFINTDKGVKFIDDRLTGIEYGDNV